MVIITFPDSETEKKALGFLMKHFSGKTLKSGEHLVPEAALEALAERNFTFTVKGKATYEHQVAALRASKSGLSSERCSTRATPLKASGGSKASATRMSRVVVDVPDTLKNRQWMKQFKSRWKKRLEQMELWMVSYPIEIE